MTDEIVQHLLSQVRNVIAKKLSPDETLAKIRSKLAGNENATSILLDVLTALNWEIGEIEKNSDVHKFLKALTDEVLPPEVLALDVNALGSDEPVTKSRIVKSKTRIYYKQVKFNLLREESEGYAKLISELLSVRSVTTADEILLAIERLIGQFNLDPNRVLDVILDCFENSLPYKDLFISILKKFKVQQQELRDILVQKFLFCEKMEYTTTDLYRIASILCQEQLVDLKSFFNMISPTQQAIVDENKRLNELIKKRASKAETISTGSLADSALNAATSAMMAGNDVPDRLESVNTVSAVSFEAASQSQSIEDKKIAGNSFEDSEVLPKNQKLGLLCALLEHGAWDLAKYLLDRLPEGYPLGISRRISAAISNIIGFMIEPFYRQKFPNWQQSRVRESWRRFTYPVSQMTSWNDLSNIVYPIVVYLGSYIGVRHEVAIKLIRLICAFYDDEEAKSLPLYISLNSTIMDICESCLVPASSMLDSNFSYCEELWQILQRFPYYDRYRIYGRWKNDHTKRSWILTIQRSKALGMTKYAMKRLSKDTAKVIGRQLGKLCHTYPLVALEYMLDKVQDFQNFIGPVVESMRFLSNLEFDVLSYCLIENLAEPEKQAYKTTDVAFSPWLSSLANFSAAVCKRYSVDFSGILQYIANQLKDGKNLDLIVLREIVANISGVESSTDVTQEHLEALCGGDILRQEAGYYSSTKVNRRATSRIREALLKNDLFESLCILIGQQKNFIIYVDSKVYPLKLTAHMLDLSQETFVQFYHFLRSNLKPEEYARRMPLASALISKYHVPTEAAMCLTRSIYFNKITSAYETSKKNFKEDAKGKLDGTQKTSFYKQAFDSVTNALEEELIRCFPETFWLDITAKLYSTFWLLSVSDLSAPLTAYGREIEKCKKELSELTHYTADSSSRARRTAKDEERLKNLEQRLSEEMKRQTEHVKRVKEILASEKEVLFAATQNRSSQMLRFLQACILPRAMFSEVDAVYCAKFIETLHTIRTGFFQTIVFFDKIFTDITPILAGLTEREANCFGRFCCMSLDMILRWHSDSHLFKVECEGFPGCITKIRKRENDESASAAEFTYEYYRSICYKWQVRLAKALGFVLTSGNYVLTRNALTLMTKILPNFPVLQLTYKTIEKCVTTVRDNEKGKRDDLNLLASSYLVQLIKRNTRLYKTDEFYDTGITKLANMASANESKQSTKASASSLTAVGTSSPAARKRTGGTTEDEKVSTNMNSGTTEQPSPKKKTKDQ
ncbi:transcription factor/nuclear export subunit protein 2 domain-containing protein [Ditylenchus destructor]|nr:transcription factor/nuclear export subunit protein 2 domain-containing protein [Ditylenchus destructor]